MTVVRPPPLWLGVHEAAHAIARMALDEEFPYPGPYLKSVTVVRDGDALGRTKQDLRQSTADLRDRFPAEFHPDMIRNAECDVIEVLAGPAAEERHRSRGWAGPLFMERHIVRTVLKIDPKAGWTDCHIVRRLLDWIGPPDMAADLKKLWFRAVILTEIEFPGIVAMGQMLCAAGTMNGDDFETA